MARLKRISTAAASDRRRCLADHARSPASPAAAFVRIRFPLAAVVASLALWGGAVSLSPVAGQPTAAPQAEGEEFSYWMDVKVKESQKIFKALAMADFKAIDESAEKLKSLNKIENFVRRSTPGYQTQLRNFEFSVNEVRRQANRKNLEGVAMGFHQLTMSCVNCHKQIRGPAKPEPTP
jgi:hypothetical protein